MIAIPATRIDGFYYALLTLGLTELCRVYVVQSQALGSATKGLYGADGILPNGASLRAQLVASYYGAVILLVAAALGVVGGFAVRPVAEYRLVALSRQRGVPPRLIDDRSFATEEDAIHAVFLRRVQDLLES